MLALLMLTRSTFARMMDQWFNGSVKAKFVLWYLVTNTTLGNSVQSTLLYH
jgi:hypothetical protein